MCLSDHIMLYMLIKKTGIIHNNKEFVIFPLVYTYIFYELSSFLFTLRWEFLQNFPSQGE